MLKIFLIIMLIFSLSGCHFDHPDQPLNYEPMMNPIPKHYITVELNARSSIKSHLMVELNMVYQTNNPDCAHESTAPDDDSQPRVKVMHAVLQDTDTSIKIPLDLYLSGVCQWQATSFSYQFKYFDKVRAVDANTTVDFVEIERQADDVFKQYWFCNEEKCALNESSVMSMPTVISSKNNHVLQLNFKMGNK
jgi:hypothetical protein